MVENQSFSVKKTLPWLVQWLQVASPGGHPATCQSLCPSHGPGCIHIVVLPAMRDKSVGRYDWAR
jgi:hypothetical protein